MLIEADLPDDVEALCALVLEQARKLDNADAEVTRLKAILDAFGGNGRCGKWLPRSMR